jgi:hypothetical protein
MCLGPEFLLKFLSRTVNELSRAELGQVRAQLISLMSRADSLTTSESKALT